MSYLRQREGLVWEEITLWCGTQRASRSQKKGGERALSGSHQVSLFEMIKKAERVEELYRLFPAFQQRPLFGWRGTTTLSRYIITTIPGGKNHLWCGQAYCILDKFNVCGS